MLTFSGKVCNLAIVNDNKQKVHMSLNVFTFCYLKIVCVGITYLRIKLITTLIITTIAGLKLASILLFPSHFHNNTIVKVAGRYFLFAVAIPESPALPELSADIPPLDT